MSELAPEGCQLVAHDTGDGWCLTVEDYDGKTIAMLAWPEVFGEEQTTDSLIEHGFEVR